MAKINQIGFFEAAKVNKLVSFICSDDIFNYQRLFFESVFSTFFQNFFPLFLRKNPETYVASIENDLKGVITTVAQTGNPNKWNIIRLFLEKNSQDVGKQLIDYVISHLGAAGVNTFFVEVDDTQTELIELFAKGSRFRMCSCIGLHKITNINFIDNEENLDFQFREFKNSDNKKVAELFNENIFAPFRNSLSKDKSEFSEKIFGGIGITGFKYLLENKTGEIISYLEITTSDNSNYMIDIVLSQGYYSLYPQILTYTIKQVMKRKHSKAIYVKNRKYLMLGHDIEQFFKDNHFEMLQNKVVLVKDFYKTVREDLKSRAMGFAEIGSSTAFNSNFNKIDK